MVKGTLKKIHDQCRTRSGELIGEYHLNGNLLTTDYNQP